MELKQTLPPRRCPICRKSITVHRNNPDEFLVWEEQFFHRDCYKSHNQYIRKCGFCNKQMELHKDNPEQAIYYKKKFYHNLCFKKWSTATKRPSRVRLTDYNNREEYIKACTNKINSKLAVKTSYKEIEAATLKTVARKFAESDIDTFIKDFYEIESVSSLIWKKLSSVYNGTYKDLEIPIPPEDLLEMWRGKKNFLRKTNAKLISNTPNIKIESLIYYDLAILVNKYEDFKKWKREQEIIALENETMLQRQEPIFSHTIPMNAQNVRSENNEDILDIVDDIFGEE